MPNISINLCIGTCNTIESLAKTILGLINNVAVPLLFAIAFIVFLWGIFQYFIAGAADEESQKKGRQLIIYGLIGFFVMLSVWGLVNVLIGTFGLGSSARPPYPLL